MNTKKCFLAVQGIEPRMYGKEPYMIPFHYTAKQRAFSDRPSSRMVQSLELSRLIKASRQPYSVTVIVQLCVAETYLSLVAVLL